MKIVVICDVDDSRRQTLMPEVSVTLNDEMDVDLTASPTSPAARAGGRGRSPGEGQGDEREVHIKRTISQVSGRRWEEV